MNAKIIGYWICTGLVCAASAMAVVMIYSRPQEALAGAAHLGYPAYFMFILTTWYGLGVLALLAPGLALLKEWTYAGFTFAYTSAIVSHLASGDGMKALGPVIALAILAGSYFLRPVGRRIPAAPSA